MRHPAIDVAPQDPPPPNRPLTKQELRAGKPPRAQFALQPRRPIRVVLDGVRQSYNVGALFRLCDGLLIERLVLCGEPVDLDKRKLVQAARGTQKWVPWEHSTSALDAVLSARAEGFIILAVEQTATSVPPESMSNARPICVVLGSECRGVSPAIVAIADQAVAIPIRGMANSLNIATAAAIVLHSLVVAGWQGRPQDLPPEPNQI